MQKIVVAKPGGYSALVMRASASEHPKPGQCIVSTKFIGVNYADVIIREGYYTAAKGRYPLTPGFEFSGYVKEVGEGVTDFKVGDEVVGISLFNGYSSEVVVEQQYLRHLPAGWDLKEAAALMVPNLTAYHALHHVAYVKTGDHLLVHSAAGGVGTALCQQAKDLGCHVVGVISCETKAKTARQHGADEVVLKSGNYWSKIDQAAPNGFDAVFDANGLTTPRPGYERLKQGGRLIVYGFAELFPRGKRPWLPTLAYRALKVPKFRIRKMTSTNRTIAGFNIAFLFERHDLAKPALDYIIENAKNGTLHKPPIEVFAFNECVKAHRRIESGETAGRILLEVPEEGATS